MDPKATIVLVHGAGTGPWIWRRVQDALPLPSVAVEVPSRRGDATPASCADDIVKQIDKTSTGRVVLVLHSLAGVLASDLALRLGDRIAATVFLAAVVPAPGRRFVDAVGLPNSLVLKVLFKLNPNGLKPSPRMLRAELANDLSEADAAALVDRYEAEWPGLYLGRVGDARHAPRPAYIRLTRDRSVPPARQDRMIANLQEPQVLALDAGHLAMLSQPEALAALIMRSVRSA